MEIPKMDMALAHEPKPTPIEEMTMITTRLKLVVNTVSKNLNPDGSTQSENISLTAVYSDKEGSANKQWSKWTPSAGLNFCVSNPGVFDRFLPGQFYYVDLIATDKDSL